MVFASMEVEFPPGVKLSDKKCASLNAFLRGWKMVEAVQRYSNSELNILSRLESLVKQASV